MPVYPTWHQEDQTLHVRALNPTPGAGFINITYRLLEVLTGRLCIHIHASLDGPESSSTTGLQSTQNRTLLTYSLTSASIKTMVVLNLKLNCLFKNSETTPAYVELVSLFSVSFLSCSLCFAIKEPMRELGHLPDSSLLLPFVWGTNYPTLFNLQCTLCAHYEKKRKKHNNYLTTYITLMNMYICFLSNYFGGKIWVPITDFFFLTP